MIYAARYFAFFLALLSGELLFPLQIAASIILKAKQHVLSVKGPLFYLNDRPFDMWGIRVASASQSEALTSHLIAQLDDYKRYGVNTIDVFLQGSSGGFSDPFIDNGKQIKADHLNRLKRIINACNEREMVVVAGIFYQRTMANMDSVRQISNGEGVRNAAETVARELKGHRNIIINIANEQNSGHYAKCQFYDFNDPENIINLCKAVKAVAPKMLVGGGGYHDEKNIIIGKSSAVDVLLFDTFDNDVVNGQHSKWHYNLFRSNGVTNKPIVNVEMFGGWTGRFMPPGVYTEAGKRTHLKDVDEAASTVGLYVHFHSNPWCQGLSVGKETHFELGGMGTAEDPGIRWWFQEVRKKAKGKGSKSSYSQQRPAIRSLTH